MEPLFSSKKSLHGKDQEGEKITTTLSSLNLSCLKTENADIAMPELSIKKLHLLPAILYTDELLQEQLSSQGPFTAPDNSYAYSHESSVSLSYFMDHMQLPCSVNMDRGGVITRPDGSHAACIADGLG